MTLAITLPDADRPDGTAELLVAYDGKHALEAQGEMPSALRRPRLLALAAAIGDTVQEIEDAAFQVFADTPLQFAGGALLARWGELVGEPRGGLPDPDYRRVIYGRIQANRSDGSTSTMLLIFRLLTQDDGDTVSYFDLYPASFLLQVIRQTPMTARMRRRVRRIMEAARPMGIGMGLVHAPAVPFQFGGAGFGVGAFAGVM